MNREIKIDNKLIRNLQKKNNFKAVNYTLTRILFHILLSISIYFLIQSNYFFLTTLLLVLHFSSFSFMGLAGIGHELLHNTVFSNKTHNQIFYKVFCILTYNNYSFFEFTHWEHHKHSLSKNDPKDLFKGKINIFHLILLLTFDFKSFYRRVRILILNSIGIIPGKIGKELYVLEINGSPGIRSSFMGYDPADGKKIGKKSDKEVFEIMLDYYSAEIHRRPLFRTEAGYIERVMIEGLKTPIRAKFDTGNGTNATMLHVDELEINGDVAIWTKEGQKFKNDIIDISLAKHLNTTDKRPVVELTVTFNNKQYTVPFGLTTRDSASEMLVNRKLLSIFKVSVNPNRKFVLSDWVPKNDRSDT